MPPLCSRRFLVPILFLAMAGSHVVVDVEREEKEIDSLIEFLLQYQPTPKLNKLPDSPVTRTPRENISKIAKGPGRPRKNSTTAESSQLSPVVESKEAGIKQSNFEVIIECLQKLNNRNKVLSNRVVELDSQLLAQEKKIEELNAKIASNSNDSDSADSREIIKVTDRVKKLEKEVLEGNIHSHFLLCRGPKVVSKIQESTENGVVNINQIKAELCSEICGDSVAEISVDSLSLNLHGKDSNMLKIECANINTRNFLIKQARSRKPHGIYVVEFLPYDKVRIFRSLHNLRRENYRRKIRSIQIRGTNIFCKTEVDDSFVHVSSLVDVEVIKKKLGGITAVSHADDDGPSGGN